MAKVSAKYVLPMLSPLQMRVRIETCEQSSRLRRNEPDLFIDRVVTEDDTPS